jgi:protein-S-isoprenylcysteine O-methyltransferase Ste14
MMDTADKPGVIASPPLLFAAAIVLGLLLDRLLPAYVLAVLLTFGERIVVGIVLMCAGACIVIPALRGFRSAGTNVEPWKPSLTLVSDGIFAWLRNPMYVGGTLFLIGLAVLLASDWMLVMTIVADVVLHFGVVLREERYLEMKFGESYRAYKGRVSRYGLPF